MAERPGHKSRDPRPLLIIMLKAPVMGRVKTRLAREIGWSPATSFARHAGRTAVAKLSSDTRWRTALAIAPLSALRSPVWPGRLRRIPQGEGDLGARMERLLVSALRPAILIGSDIPGMSAAHIAEAFRLLRSHEMVFGPAEDGGYWLVGASRQAPLKAMFTNVRWSTPHALADTVTGLKNVAIGYAARLADVDNGESYLRLKSVSGRVILPVKLSCTF
jgi:rSAM/selenodomain-associated transferase 1